MSGGPQNRTLQKYNKGTTHGRLRVNRALWGDRLRDARFEVTCLDCQGRLTVNYEKLRKAVNACRTCYLAKQAERAKNQPRAASGMSQWGFIPRHMRKGSNVMVVSCCNRFACPICAGTNRTVKFAHEVTDQDRRLA